MSTDDRDSKPEATERFWALIDRHVVILGDGAVEAGALASAVARLPEEEALSFELSMREAFTKSRRWELWGAAFLIHSGCPDDTFDYFRSWLIGRGRAVFEAALRDPDSLAEVATEEALDDEVYCAGQVAIAQRGGSGDGSGPASYPPLDRSFDFADDREMRRRYPKLYRSFRGD